MTGWVTDALLVVQRVIYRKNSQKDTERFSLCAVKFQPSYRCR